MGPPDIAQIVALVPYVLPLLLLVAPLLAGRYPGEASLERLRARRPRAARRRPAVQAPCAAPAEHRLLPRGGLLVGRSLAVRPPPFLLAASS
jgi:hypothetical protein